MNTLLARPPAQMSFDTRAQCDPGWTDSDIATIVADFLRAQCDPGQVLRRFQIDPGVQIDPGDGMKAQIDPTFAARKQADPGSQVDPGYQVDPGLQVDPGVQIDPGWQVDPGNQLDPGMQVDPGIQIDPGTQIDPGFTIKAQVDPGT